MINICYEFRFSGYTLDYYRLLWGKAVFSINIERQLYIVLLLLYFAKFIEFDKEKYKTNSFNGNLTVVSSVLCFLAGDCLGSCCNPMTCTLAFGVSIIFKSFKDKLSSNIISKHYIKVININFQKYALLIWGWFPCTRNTGRSSWDSFTWVRR